MGMLWWGLAGGGGHMSGPAAVVWKRVAGCRVLRLRGPEPLYPAVLLSLWSCRPGLLLTECDHSVCHRRSAHWPDSSC